MDFDEKKVWKTLAIIGTIITAICLGVSLFQFFVDNSPNVSILRKIDRIVINAIAFILFLKLLLAPINFYIYAFLFYYYGIGNIFDGGSILAVLCLGISFLFLNYSNFFKKLRTVKILLFVCLPVFMLAVQFFTFGLLTFLISLMHIVGGIYIGFLGFALLYPMIKKSEALKNEILLDNEKCTTKDIEFLTFVLEGQKYKKIATIYNISESSVKARMVELYRILHVKNRAEFLGFYKGCSFKIKENISDK